MEVFYMSHYIINNAIINFTCKKQILSYLYSKIYQFVDCQFIYSNFKEKQS